MKHRKVRRQSSRTSITVCKKPIAAGVALALGAASASGVSAQEQETIEEVITTGIRSSLTTSMNIKRDSQGLVDGIVSEDIGKFPDTNLAESMQRIPGVSIDRSAIGEGQKVTVRGVGPDFNLVLLNGRQMPGASIQETTASDSRAFDFANLASEAIAAVEIHKTSRANVPTGGIGATVNIVTARPLSNPEMIFNVGAKGVFDQSVDKGDSVTPELSGIFSTTNDDETLGIAVSASYQDRNLGYNQAAVANGWPVYAGDEANWGTIPFAGDPGSENITNRPDATDIYSVPQNLLYSFNEVQRERTNGQLTLQYRPVEAVTATLDYTYSENKLATQRSELSAWFNFGPSVTSWTDGPVAAPLVYSETIDPAGADLCSGGAEYATKNENNSLGLNVAWDYSDRLGFEFDYHNSTADSGADSPYGSNAVIGACGFFRGTTTADFRGDFPILSIALPPGQSGLDAAQMLQTGRSFRNSVTEAEVEQARLSGFFEFDDEATLDFGIQSTQVNNFSAFTNVQTDSWGGYGTPADYPDAIWGEVRSVPGQFDNMPGASSPNIFPEYYDWNFETVRQAGIGVPGTDPASFAANFNVNSPGATNRTTDEDSLSVYMQYNQAFELGGRPADFRVGMRYEDTEVTSRALVPEAVGVKWVAANEQSVIFSSDPVFTTLKGDYDYWLPNLDLNVEVADNMVVRASYGRTIGRPGWGNIQGGQTIAQLARVTNGTGSQGNPGLLPLVSDNYDLSFEWYYSESSYAAVSYFRKEIDNYVGSTTIQDTPFNLPNPADGPRYREAQAAVGNDFVDIRNYIFANYGGTPEVNQTGTDANGDATGDIFGIAGVDDPLVFNITIPTNEQSASIDGWEFSVQHMFGETGFGASANFTVVDSDAKYDNTVIASNQFAIEGLSDSANLIGFYENDKWSLRVAYNWRDEFLTARSDGNWKGVSNPIYTDAYGQWDVNLSYNVNDNLSIFAEGINVTDEIIRLRGRAANQTMFVTQTGPRYMIGARYNIY